MPKDLAHLDQGGAAPKEFGGKRMTQAVCTDTRHLSPIARPARHVADQVGPNCSCRGLARQENLPNGCCGPWMAEIGAECFAHITRQRQTVLSAGLAAHDDLASTPIDITQLKAGDLCRAQAETGDQRQDG